MKFFIYTVFFCLAFVPASFAQTPDANGILYVKTGSGGNGSSWTNALGELATALKAANEATLGTIKQIWVAAGTYYPLYAADFSSTDNRDKSFVLVKDVKLYGGFAGTEAALANRDLTLTGNKSILSGDLGTLNTPTDNAYHVVVMEGTAGTAELNGFTVTGGYANRSGTLLINGNPITGSYGGAMQLAYASPLLTNIEFISNTAANGGAIYIHYDNTSVFDRVTFSGNRSSLNGGAICIAVSAAPVFKNVQITGNIAANYGGAVVILANAGYTVSFLNTVISGNSSTNGAIYTQTANLIMQNSIVYGNSHGILSTGGSDPNTIVYSLVQGVYADAANNIMDGATDPLFVTPDAYSNAPSTAGNYALQSISPVINKGSNALYAGLDAATTDLAENARVYQYAQSGIIDMGAFEYQGLPGQIITVADMIKTYGDAAFEPIATASSGLTVALQSSDNSIAEAFMDAADGNKWKLTIKKAGIVTVTASQPGNTSFAAATNKTFTVTINPAVLTVTATDSVKIYNGLAFNGGNGIAITGFVNNETAAVVSGTVTYSGNAQGAIVTGIYDITPAGLTAANYYFDYVTGKLTVDKASLSITAKDSSLVYNGVAFAGGNGITYSGFVNGEDSATTLTGTVAYSGSSQGAVNVNSYNMTPGGLVANNYNITYQTGTLTVKKAALIATAKDSSKVYNGLTFSNGNGVTYAGFVNNEDSAYALTGTLTYSGSSQGAKNVNSYDIVPGGLAAANYSLTYANGTLTITKAALVVKANDTARCYGIANPVFKVSYNGWVNNETTAVLATTAIASSMADMQSAAGNYTIVPSGATASNYAISYINGVLQVNALPVSTITATAGTVLCGNNDTLIIKASGNFTYEWYIDNAMIANETGNQLNAFNTGAYTAKATDANGCVNLATNSVALTRLLKPTPAFSFDSYCQSTAVTFINSSDVAVSGIVDYTWSSGDGQSSASVAPQIVYATPGNYTVGLTATPQACPSLAVTVTHPVSIEALIPGIRLNTVNTTANLPTAVTARNLTNASYTWIPASGVSNTTVYNPVITISKQQDYLVQMDFPSGCVTVDTLLVTALVTTDVLVPNAFTPNGDGQNDLLRVNLRGAKQLHYFKVFNRWGKLVFVTKDPAKGWDGRWYGELQPLATYVWTVEAVDDNGHVFHRQGAVTLLR